MEESCSTLARKRARPKAASSFSNETNPTTRRRVFLPSLSLFLSNEMRFKKKKAHEHTRGPSRGVGGDGFECSPLSMIDLPVFCGRLVDATIVDDDD